MAPRHDVSWCVPWCASLASHIPFSSSSYPSSRKGRWVCRLVVRSRQAGVFHPPTYLV